MRLMKIIPAIFVALFLTTAQAKEAPQALCLPNKAGGRIILTKQVSEKHGLPIVIAHAENGTMLYGHWILVGKSTVLVVWADKGDMSVFDARKFIPCEL